MTPRRLRRARLTLALVMLAGAAALLVTVWARRPPPAPAGARLGVSVTRTARGFTLVRSASGRKLFALRAKLATELSQPDRVELSGVDVQIFDPDGRHLDEIRGDEFEYDPKTNTARARSLVHLALEAELPTSGERTSGGASGGAGEAGDAFGAPGAAGAPGQEPIEVTTRDLTFNTKTGDGQVTQGLSFRYMAAAGEARSAKLDAERDQVQLSGGVRLVWRRPGRAPLQLWAGAARIDRPSASILLTGSPRIEEGGSAITAQSMTLLLRGDYSVRAVVAKGDVRATSSGNGETLRAGAAAARLDVLAPLHESVSAPAGGVAAGASSPPPARGVGLDGRLDGRLADLELSGNAEVEREAEGNAKGRAGKGAAATQRLRLRAERIRLVFVQGNQPRSAVAEGDARLTLTRGEGEARGEASGEAGGGANGEATVAAPILTFAFASMAGMEAGEASQAGARLRRVTATGGATARFAAPGQAPVTARAPRMSLALDLRGRPQEAEASGEGGRRVEVEQAASDSRNGEAEAAGQVGAAFAGSAAPRRSTCDDLRASFSVGRVVEVVETGRVALSQGEASARADQAVFTPAAALDPVAIQSAAEKSSPVQSASARSAAAGEVTLRAEGSSAYTHGLIAAKTPEMRLAAPWARWRGEEIEAGGGVSVSLAPRAATSAATVLQPGKSPAAGGGTGPGAPPGPWDGAQSINVAARTMRLEQNGARGEFSGGARLWQGANVLVADHIAYSRAAQSVTARGDVRVALVAPRGWGGGAMFGAAPHAPSSPAASGEGRESGGGATAPITLRAARFAYDGGRGEAVFSGGAQVTSGEGALVADEISIFITSPEAARGGEAAIRRLTASGDVELRQPGREAKGDRLVYDAAADRVELSGGPPSVYDARLGFLTGSALTFTPSGATIRVESGGGERTYGASWAPIAKVKGKP